MTSVSVSAQHISQFGIPPGCVIELRLGFASVFNDGRLGLNSNKDAQQAPKTRLRECIACVKRNVPSFKIIDADAWASKHASSSDWIVLFSSPVGLKALQIEGKLGLDFEYPGDKAGSSVTESGLLEKFNGTKTIAKSLPFKNVLLVIVPRFGKEHMWWRVRKWGKGQTALNILSCCAEEILALCFGAPIKCCDSEDEKANTRRVVAQMELDS